MEGIRNINARLGAVFAAAGLMLCAFFGLTATAYAATDYSNLSQGAYTVSFDMINYAQEADGQKSMSDGAVEKPLKLTVDSNGNYTATITMQGLTIGQMKGYLKELSYYENGAFKRTTVVSYYDLKDDFNRDADWRYPEQISFPLVNKAKGDYTSAATGNSYVRLQVFVPIMEAISTGSGTQDVLMKIDWSSLKSVAQPVTPSTPDTPVTPVAPAVTKVTSGKVTYTKSGGAATVSSINKKAKAVSVKSKVKIGGKSYKVTAIAKNAALNAKNLKTITLGKNIKSIGKNAFKGINKKAVIKAPKAQLSKYKKLCKKAGAPKTVKYKAA